MRCCPGVRSKMDPKLIPTITSEALKETSHARVSEKEFLPTLVSIISNKVRDKRFRTENGYVTTFSQELPIISDNAEFSNAFEVTKYKKLSTLTPS